MSDNLPLVLIISDDDNTRKQLISILRQENICRTVQSGGGRKALEKAVSLEPDLIVAPHTMSGMDISHFCSILQANPETAYIPTVIIYDSDDITEGSLPEKPVGAVDIAICPLMNTHKFLDIVKQHLETKKRWLRLNREPDNSTDQPVTDEYFDFISYLADSMNLDQNNIKILQQANRNSIYTAAHSIGLDEETLSRYLADYLHLDYYTVIDPENIDSDAFPVPFSRSKLVLALRMADESLKYILCNPFDLQLRDMIDLISGESNPPIGITQPESILAVLKSETTRESEVEVVSMGHDDDEEDEEQDSDLESELPYTGILEIEHEPTKEDINTSPIKYIADKIMFAAVHEGASDIHMEPKAGKTVVRFRVDGDMTDKFTLKSKTGRTLLSRFKVLADMDIAERRKPQDGALEARIAGKHYKMRLATTSTPHGESIVIRLLNMDSEPMKLAELGMTPDQAATMYDVSEQHTGAIIVVGTTGSGKSTTLYSLISNIDIQNKSLMTIEDPVEYEIKYANQQEVNEKAGVTFEALLKSAVRQDPDIIYLGEIRDPFTAKTVMDLASTGHLTFGTLHSANTTTSIGRLERLGVSRGDIIDSVLLIESQRLIKRLCAKCRKIRPIKPDEVEMISLFTDNVPKELADPIGCPECKNKGYKGRQGIYETLRFDPKIISIVKKNEPVSIMRRKLHNAGQYLMSDHAIDLLREFTICYNDVYHLVFLEEKRLTGGTSSDASELEFEDTGPGIIKETVPENEVQVETSHVLHEDKPVSLPGQTRIVESKPFVNVASDDTAAQERSLDTSGINILVVDDDPDLREFITFLLSKSGYNVTSTGDGVDAIVTLSTQKFDLILSDVDMPNLNGFKLLEVINSKGISTPVVFLTARDNQEDEIKGYELGALDYIRKPIHKNTLLMRIGRIFK